jgi:hypothetical protein
MSKNNIQTEIIEKALFMYKETVSPSRDAFINILNQIPEKEPLVVSRRVTRSPYIWIAFAEVATLCSLLFVVYPTFSDMQKSARDPFYQIDNQVNQFEASIDAQDIQIAEQDSLL